MCSGVLHEVENTILHLLRTTQRVGSCDGISARLLDIGCWDGRATQRYARAIGARAHGVEVFPAPAEEAAGSGVEVQNANLEHEALPWPDATFDVVIANQVFEHLKNIWLPLAEVYRVLRPGGTFVLSVPNLGSLHNRILLLVGRQPTSIRVLGPHVRGYTLGSLCHLVTLNDAFRLTALRGVGFYPFPARLAYPLVRLWPAASHTLVLLLKKVGVNPVSPWMPLPTRYRDVAAQTLY
jgi:SAM-dependent methyltransferase